MSVPSVCPLSCHSGKGQGFQVDGLCLVPSWSRGFVVLAPGHVGRCLGTKCAVPLHRGCAPHAVFMVVAKWAGPSHVCPLAGQGEGVCLDPGVLFGGPGREVGASLGVGLITSSGTRGGGAFLLPIQGAEPPAPVSTHSYLHGRFPAAS